MITLMVVLNCTVKCRGVIFGGGIFRVFDWTEGEFDDEQREIIRKCKSLQKKNQFLNDEIKSFNVTINKRLLMAPDSTR